MKKYERQKGFAIKKYRIDLHKNNRVKKRIFTCEKAGKYKSNKNKPMEQQRNKESKKTDCKWHINLNNPVFNNSVVIIYAFLKHNHVIHINN